MDMADMVEELELKVTYRDRILDITLSNDATLQDLALSCADEIEAEIERMSLFILPKPGLTKSPFPDRKLSDILTPTSRIKVVGTPTKDVKRLDEIASRIQSRATARQSRQTVKASRSRDWRRVREESMYTFHTIEPLSYLPNPERSRRFLERLANDPGIKASMRKHKFSVSLLTEMNPAEHTTHESKTLGLNRNKGEVIELRLRTDRYDGYRDYKVIRKTLCHELSHNVWSEHDRNFWDLTKEIEQEVDRNDWTRGGHKLSESEFYNPDDNADDLEHTDSGGWTGGDFILGRSSNHDQSSELGLSRREIMARAALRRLEKQDDLNHQEREEKQHQPSNSDNK